MDELEIMCEGECGLAFILTGADAKAVYDFITSHEVSLKCGPCSIAGDCHQPFTPTDEWDSCPTCRPMHICPGCGARGKDFDVKHENGKLIGWTCSQCGLLVSDPRKLHPDNQPPPAAAPSPEPSPALTPERLAALTSPLQLDRIRRQVMSNEEAAEVADTLACLTRLMEAQREGIAFVREAAALYPSNPDGSALKLAEALGFLDALTPPATPGGHADG